MTFDTPPDAHEPPAVDTRRVLLLVGGFVAFAAVLIGGLQFYYDVITRGEKLTTTLQNFPAPELQPNPLADYNAFRAAQEEQLAGTAWLDPAHTRLHVPIDRAMRIVAARGQHAYAPVAGTPPFPAPGTAPLDGAPRAAAQPMATPFGLVR